MKYISYMDCLTVNGAAGGYDPAFAGASAKQSQGGKSGASGRSGNSFDYPDPAFKDCLNGILGGMVAGSVGGPGYAIGGAIGGGIATCFNDSNGGDINNSCGGNYGGQCTW